MSKAKLNFLIDAIMFILMGLLTGIGLLIKYVLLSGSDSWVKYGKNLNLTLWGLDRHDWGKIHLIVAFVLIFFLILHIIFHWKMILSLYKKILKGKAGRIITAIIFLFITLYFICFPFISNINIQEQARGLERFKENKNNSGEVVIHKEKNNKQPVKNIKNSHKNSSFNALEIKGYMTLKEVSNQYNIPADYIKKQLAIPLNISNNSQLGHLRKKYAFTMSDIENIITSYKQNKR